MNRTSTCIWMMILIVASLVPIPAAMSAEVSETGCLTIPRIQAHDPACVVLVHSGCSHPLDLTITYEVSTMRFSKQPIPSRGLHADHHGEPAYGSYEAERTESDTHHARLEPGESKWFARPNPAESMVITECRVTAVGHWKITGGGQR